MGLTSFGPPPMPRWLLVLRAATLVTSVGVLAAAAYNVSLYAGLIVSATPAGFLIFNAVFNLLIVGSMLACEFALQRYYNRLAFTLLLGLDGVFWLAGWAWAASWAGRWLSFDSDGASSEYDAFAGSITAGAVLGAITWVMIVVATFAFARACLRDTSDEIADYGPEYGSPEYYAHAAELGQRKPEGAAQYPPPPQEPRYT